MMSTLTLAAMPDLHVVQCSCHGQMIWVRAVDIFTDTGDQIVCPTFDFENVLGLVTTPAYTNSPSPHQSLIDRSPSSGAVTTHPSLMPTTPTAHCGVCGAIDVPQRPYRSVLSSPDQTYKKREVIMFSRGGCGVPIADAAENRLSGLLGGNELVFVGATVSTFSIRIEWPGYRMWTGQFRAKSWGGNNDPVTRSRLATQIAKRVVEFLGLMEEVESTDMVWKVGRGHITAKDLVLVSLTQVSKGSWQPLLRLLP